MIQVDLHWKVVSYIITKLAKVVFWIPWWCPRCHLFVTGESMICTINHANYRMINGM
jgi:hypothetical protein